MDPGGSGWGDSEWQDDEEVRVLRGEDIDPWKTFDQCCGSWRFPNGLMQFLKDAGFRHPTPIQAYTWPVLMGGKDVIGVAKTGSGKTLGYLLPGYIKVKRQEMDHGLNCSVRYGPAMVVIAPTRELGQQIYEESERFGRPAEIASVCVYGGAPKAGQKQQLRNGPQCVVATPGRLKDFLDERSISVSQCCYLVLDEADRMLDMGFAPSIEAIMEWMPHNRQTALFTATWPRDVRDVAARVTHTATHVQVGSNDSATTNADITQHVRIVNRESDKLKFLEEEIFPILQRDNSSCLIFLKTKRGCADLFHQLSRAGAPIVQLHGDLTQEQRDHALWAFKNGKAKVLVATDVAQRGLDIKNVNIVVNYDPPSNGEDYVHRIGRTGRAGEKGDAYTMLYENDKDIADKIVRIMRKSGKDIPYELSAVAAGAASGWGAFGGKGKGVGPELNGQWGGKYANYVDSAGGYGGGYGGGRGW